MSIRYMDMLVKGHISGTSMCNKSGICPKPLQQKTCKRYEKTNNQFASRYASCLKFNSCSEGVGDLQAAIRRIVVSGGLLGNVEEWVFGL